MDWFAPADCREFSANGSDLMLEVLQSMMLDGAEKLEVSEVRKFFKL